MTCTFMRDIVVKAGVMQMKATHLGIETPGEKSRP